MFKSIFSSLLLVSIIKILNAHTLITNVNGGTVGLRKITTTNPVKDFQGNDMLCGIGAQPSSGTLDIKAGEPMTLNFFNTGLKEVIPASHVGPCMVYIAEASSPSKFSKFFELGIQASGESCISGIDKNGKFYATGISKTGELTFNLPSNLKSGKYIVRSELLALHIGFRVGGAEFYPQCIDINVTGPDDGVGVGTNAVTIPGHLNENTPGVVFGIYSGKNAQYKIPGPQLDSTFTFGNTGTSPENSSPTASNTPASESSPASNTPVSESYPPASNTPVSQ